MACRTFRYCPAVGHLVEVVRSADPAEQFYVHGDIPAFVSPLDFTVVEGRRQYEDHMKRHNVVPAEAGFEKVRPPPPNRTQLREYLWEAVDRSIQRYRRK